MDPEKQQIATSEAPTSSSPSPPSPPETRLSLLPYRLRRHLSLPYYYTLLLTTLITFTTLILSLTSTILIERHHSAPPLPIEDRLPSHWSGIYYLPPSENSYPHSYNTGVEITFLVLIFLLFVNSLVDLYKIRLGRMCILGGQGALLLGALPVLVWRWVMWAKEMGCSDDWSAWSGSCYTRAWEMYGGVMCAGLVFASLSLVGVGVVLGMNAWRVVRGRREEI